MVSSAALLTDSVVVRFRSDFLADPGECAAVIEDASDLLESLVLLSSFVFQLVSLRTVPICWVILFLSSEVLSGGSLRL